MKVTSINSKRWSPERIQKFQLDLPNLHWWRLISQKQMCLCTESFRNVLFMWHVNGIMLPNHTPFQEMLMIMHCFIPLYGSYSARYRSYHWSIINGEHSDNVLPPCMISDYHCSACTICMSIKDYRNMYLVMGPISTSSKLSDWSFRLVLHKSYIIGAISSKNMMITGYLFAW